MTKDNPKVKALLGALHGTKREIPRPKLDYWMIDILKKAMTKWASAKKCPLLGENLRGTSAFKFTELGQFELIRERLNEIQQHYDEEIKEGLNRGSD